MPRGQTRAADQEPEVKVDPAPAIAPEKAKEPAAPTAQEPIEMEHAPNPEQPELDTDVEPSEECVREVAIQLAFQSGERYPLNTVCGQPIWMAYEALARAGLTAFLYMEKRRG